MCNSFSQWGIKWKYYLFHCAIPSEVGGNEVHILLCSSRTFRYLRATSISWTQFCSIFIFLSLYKFIKAPVSHVGHWENLFPTSTLLKAVLTSGMNTAKKIERHKCSVLFMKLGVSPPFVTHFCHKCDIKMNPAAVPYPLSTPRTHTNPHIMWDCRLISATPFFFLINSSWQITFKPPPALLWDCLSAQQQRDIKVAT